MLSKVFVIVVSFFLLFSAGCDNPTSSNDGNAPGILSISPANNSTGVSQNTEYLRVTFDREMRGEWSLDWNINAFYSEGESRVHWNEDGTELFIRIAADNDGNLYPGATYWWALNPSWYDHEYRLQCIDGEHLEEHEIQFTVAGSPDNEAPGLSEIRLLCGDSWDDLCGEQDGDSWTFNDVPKTLRWVGIVFDKPMTALGWGYTGPLQMVERSIWSDQSLFYIQIDEDSTTAGGYEWILNPSDYEVRFRSVWGVPFPETSFTLNIVDLIE